MGSIRRRMPRISSSHAGLSEREEDTGYWDGDDEFGGGAAGNDVDGSGGCLI